MNTNKKGLTFLEKFSGTVTKASGSSAAIIIAFLVILIWILSGPFFQYSDTWQLVINTSTTIITFLMVFLIQRSQNKDSIAIHLKLNELISAQRQCSNHLVSVENLSEKDLNTLKSFYESLAELAKNDISLEESHSIGSAANNHKNKISSKEKN